MKILSLSGYVPEQICDVTRFTQYEGKHKISHYCGYVADFISQVLEDENIDGAVFPKSCDSSRVIASYLQDSGKFLYQLAVPSNNMHYGVDYLADQIEDYHKAIQKHYHISDIDIYERTELINCRNREIENFYNEVGITINYYDYISEIHRILVTPLKEQKLKINFTNNIIGKRVYIVGSFLSNHKIAKTIEQAGMNIVGDNLTESKRLFSAPAIDCKGNIYENIAKSMLQNKLSPTQNNFAKIINDDLCEMEEKNVQGVIFITQKYCEPYDYLYSVYKKTLDEKGIPTLKVSVSDSTDGRRLEFALEAFADTL